MQINPYGNNTHCTPLSPISPPPYNLKQTPSSPIKLLSNSPMALTITSFFLLSITFLATALADHILYTDEVLMAGQNLTNGPHLLTMHPNCTLTLYTHSTPTWSTNTSTTTPNTDCYLALTQRGQLNVRHRVHYPVWSSIARSRKGKYAMVLDDKGRIAVYGYRRWSTSNSNGFGGPDVSYEEAEGDECVLRSGHRLAAGEKLRYKEYELGFWKCNLVINDTKSGRWLWQTNTKAVVAPSPAGCYLELENSGELSVKNGGQRIWSSNKRGDSGRYVGVLRFDGRLAVYGPLVWANVRMDDSVGIGLYDSADGSSQVLSGFM